MAKTRLEDLTSAALCDLLPARPIVLLPARMALAPATVR